MERKSKTTVKFPSTGVTPPTLLQHQIQWSKPQEESLTVSKVTSRSTTWTRNGPKMGSISGGTVRCLVCIVFLIENVVLFLSQWKLLDLYQYLHSGGNGNIGKTPGQILSTAALAVKKLVKVEKFILWQKKAKSFLHDFRRGTRCTPSWLLRIVPPETLPMKENKKKSIFFRKILRCLCCLTIELIKNNKHLHATDRHKGE